MKALEVMNSRLMGQTEEAAQNRPLLERGASCLADRAFRRVGARMEGVEPQAEPRNLFERVTGPFVDWAADLGLQRAADLVNGQPTQVSSAVEGLVVSHIIDPALQAIAQVQSDPDLTAPA